MPSGKKTAKKAKAAKTPTKNRPAPKKKTAAPKAARTKAPKPAKAKAPARKAAPAPKPAKKPAKAPPRRAAPAPPPKAAKAKAKAPPKTPIKVPPRAPVKVPPKAPAKKPAKAPAKAPPAPAKAPAKPTPATKPTVKPSAAPAKRPAPVQKPASAAKAPPAAPPAPAAAPAPLPKPAAASAAPSKAAKAAKRKPIPTTSLAATPVIRPLGAEAPEPAPPPPPAKPGHVDHQVLSAISYGLFAAVNKTFGFAGQSVVKNAALRMLEYGYRRGWLPPKNREPIRALNEFFGRLETMGYAEKIHVGKHGEGYALEVQGLADFDAVWSLKEMHYPLLPIFLGEMMQNIVDQYFGLKVTAEPLEMQEQKRGFVLRFSLHERPTGTDVSRIVQYSRANELEE